jgi:hypothetical protein
MQMDGKLRVWVIKQTDLLKQLKVIKILNYLMVLAHYNAFLVRVQIKTPEL